MNASLSTFMRSSNSSFRAGISVSAGIPDFRTPGTGALSRTLYL